MATRFAISTGNWSNTAIWDNGVLPASDDVIHANGFTVTLDQDITVGSLRNTISPVYLPDMPIPLMTGNTLPSGVVFAGQSPADAFELFDRNSATVWTATPGPTCFVGYQFPTGKVIKRYFIRKSTGAQIATAWTFEGSNDGISYTVLETVTGNAPQLYTSGILANTTSYTYYRVVFTASGAATTTVQDIEMTESVGTVYGTNNGGVYTVPNTLSGSRNITQTGDGIISNNTATVVTTNNTTGNTVNFNVSGTGLILNQLNQTTTGDIKVINIAGNGTVNFNSNIYGSQAIMYNNTGAIYIGANATVTINGNVYIAKGQTTVSSVTINLPDTLSNSAILNINGNIIGNNVAPTSYIFLGSTATINVTGNLISDVSPCILTGSINAFAGGSGNINLVGTASMTNSTSQPCIISRGTLVTVTGSVINKGNNMALWCAKLRFQSSSNPYWVFQDTTGSDITLTYGTATGAYPNESDVRLGVTYAATPTRTGTCAVPLPQYVSQGVPVGSSVGTAYLDAEAVWNVLTSTMTTPGSIGERLKVASTIETTGDQLAAYQV